jgi:hypothetical protein
LLFDIGSAFFLLGTSLVTCNLKEMIRGSWLWLNYWNLIGRIDFADFSDIAFEFVVWQGSCSQKLWFVVSVLEFESTHGPLRNQDTL